LEKEVPSLQGLLSHYDPLRVMHRAAHTLIPLFIKYRSENEYESAETHYLPTVEYFQYLIARTAIVPGNELSEESWDQIWTQGLNVFELTQSYLNTRPTLTTPPTAIDDLRFEIDQRRLGIE
jgi:hypothetical protein